MVCLVSALPVLTRTLYCLVMAFYGVSD